jgi:hypothetical protein
MKEIHIFGNSPELLDLNPADFDNATTLGVNASYLWKPDMDFFVTGHTMWAYLYDNFANVKRMFFFHGDPKDLEMPKMVNVNHNSVTMTCPSQLSEPGVLIGANMIGFSASHLACKLGAEKIVYHGFDSTQPEHFYDYEPFKGRITANCEFLLKNYPDNELLQIVTDDFLNNTTWRGKMVDDYGKNLKEYIIIFQYFKRLGITVEVPLKKGIVYEAASRVWEA